MPAEQKTVTTINPGEDHWSTSLVGDNADRAEALKSYETPDAFLTEFDGLKNKDWRKEIAGDDDKFLSTLQRYNSAADLGNAFREQRTVISSGAYKAPPGPEAKPEDIAAYREANGIPAEPKGYLENLPTGMVVGEQDKAIFEDFMGALHAKNAPPEYAHAAIEWYNNFAEQQQDQIAQMDLQQSTEANDQLRTDWGPDYRANINLVNGLVASTFGKEAAEQILNGRYQDGRAFMNDPNVLKGLAALARVTNPVMEMGGDSITAQQSLNDEIKDLEKFMKEHRTEYNNDVAKQDRLRSLYDIRIKQAAK